MYFYTYKTTSRILCQSTHREDLIEAYEKFKEVLGAERV
jgi:hypothetical protein